MSKLLTLCDASKDAIARRFMAGVSVYTQALVCDVPPEVIEDVLREKLACKTDPHAAAAREIIAQALYQFEGQNHRASRGDELKEFLAVLESVIEGA